MSFFKSITLAALMFCSSTIYAQQQGKVYVQDNTAKIFENNKLLAYPWLGGMNSLQLTQGDVNNDGIKDIIAFDHVNNKIFPFIHQGGVGIKYTYDPTYAKNFPPCFSYLILKDYNCDGVPDLFHRGMAGISVYRGYYQNNQLKFVQYKELYYLGGFGNLPINAYVQPSDVPSIIDMDNDGDMDFASFDIYGNYINYYKNTAIENGLPCDSINIVLENNCWGKAQQNSINRTYFLNVNCKGGSPNGGGNIGNILDTTLDISGTETIGNNVAGQRKPKRHSGNCMLHLDADGDGDKDVLISSVGLDDVQYLHNTGTPTAAFIGSQDSIWNNFGDKVYCPRFIAISGLDVDNDNKQDLVFSAHTERSASEFYTNNKLYFQKNISNNNVPDFAATSDVLLFNQTVDLGSYTYPTFFDYDKDGKKDLFIGSAGICDTSDLTLRSTMYHYKNISDTNNIKFELVTKDFLNLSTDKYQGMYPHFADITGEGVVDLIMGNNKGQIVVYKNTKTSNTTMPTFVWLTDSFANIKVQGDYSAPCMFDIDFDGRKDLIIGTQSGKLAYYQDTSTVLNVSAFQYKTGSLGGLIAGKNNYAYGYAAPIITKLDSTNRFQLVIGTGDGTIERYDSLKENIYGPYPRIDSFYSFIEACKGAIDQRATVAVADLDNDGDNEMIVGNKLGGIQFFQQVLLIGSGDTISDPVDTTNAINNLVKDQYAFTVYPNPVTTEFTIENRQLSNNFNIDIYHTNGQLVQSQKDLKGKTVTIQVGNLPIGVYYYKIYDNKYVKYGSMYKQ